MTAEHNVGRFGEHLRTTNRTDSGLTNIWSELCSSDAREAWKSAISRTKETANCSDVILSSTDPVTATGDRLNDKTEKGERPTAIKMLVNNLDALMEGKAIRSGDKVYHSFGAVEITKSPDGTYELNLNGSKIKIDPKNQNLQSLSPEDMSVSVNMYGQITIVKPVYGGKIAERKYFIGRDMVTMQQRCPGQSVPPVWEFDDDYPSHDNWFRTRSNENGSSWTYHNVKLGVPVTLHGGTQVTFKEGQTIVSNNNEGTWTLDFDQVSPSGAFNGKSTITFKDTAGNIKIYQRPADTGKDESDKQQYTQKLSDGLTAEWFRGGIRVQMRDGNSFNVYGYDPFNSRNGRKGLIHQPPLPK